MVSLYCLAQSYICILWVIVGFFSLNRLLTTNAVKFGSISFISRQVYPLATTSIALNQSQKDPPYKSWTSSSGVWDSLPFPSKACSWRRCPFCRSWIRRSCPTCPCSEPSTPRSWGHGEPCERGLWKNNPNKEQLSSIDVSEPHKICRLADSEDLKLWNVRPGTFSEKIIYGCTR